MARVNDRLHSFTRHPDIFHSRIFSAPLYVIYGRRFKNSRLLFLSELGGSVKTFPGDSETA